MSNTINFYSAWYCPFAQRTWAALEYLGIPYEYKETDPYDKTEQWLQISRGRGQVPVLQVTKGDRTEALIPDSIRTIEYLDEIADAGLILFPDDAIARSEVRFWLDHQGREIVPQLYRFLKAENGSAAAYEAKAALIAGLKALTKAMSSTGPYFFRDGPGVIDFTLAPFALRIEILLSHYKEFNFEALGDAWPRVEAWFKAVKSHPAFIATIPEPETYEARLIEFYLPYSQGGGQKDVTLAA